MKTLVSASVMLLWLATTVQAQAQASRMIGTLQVSDVEVAFGLEAGSVFIEGDAEFTTIKNQNLWTEYQGLPFYLSRFVPAEFESSPPRQVTASFLAAAGRPMLQITPDSWFERFLTGCFYLPREQ